MMKTEKDRLVIANIIAVTENVMKEVSGGADLADEIKRDGCSSPFCEATAVMVNNKLNLKG